MVIVATVLGACSSGVERRPGATPGTDGTHVGAPPPAADPSFPVGPVRWGPCTDDASLDTTCAEVEVPLDHGNPNGATITLALARRAALGPDRLGTLFVNPGGPGASGVEFVRRFDPHGLQDRFDVVSWDPRGVGASVPLDCDDGAEVLRGLDWSPDSDAERAALDGAARAIADDCAERHGDLLAHLSTEDTARDLDLLRRAVGDDRLTFVGFSYGTAIGQAYARLFPDRVRALVLDGVVDPRDRLAQLLANQTTAIEAAWATVNASCTPATSCPLDDPAGTFGDLTARLDRSDLIEPTDGLSPARADIAAIITTYDTGLRRSWFDALAAARHGRDRPMIELADTYFGLADYDAYVATVCVDGPRPSGSDGWDELAAGLTARSPRFGATVANELRPCAFWSAAPVGTPGPVRPDRLAPTLVVGGTDDPATPYAQAEAVAAMLPGARLLTYDAPGHVAFGRSACVQRAVVAYVTDLRLPAPGATCR